MNTFFIFPQLILILCLLTISQVILSKLAPIEQAAQE